MELKLRPSQKQIEDLRLLSTCDSLDVIASRIADSTATVLSPSDAKKELDSLASEISSELRSILFRQAMGLRAIMSRGDFTAESVMQSLLEVLQRNPEFKVELADWKKNAQNPIMRILDSRFLRIVSKSANLAYDYAYLLRTARIITDARPVFSEYNGVVDGIDGVVVSHVLRLEYENADNQQSLSIVLDHLDVKKLRDACDRALQKADAAEKRFSINGIPTKVTGKEED